MQINFQRLSALVKKEAIQLLRDRRFLVLALTMTLAQLFVYGYAVSMTVYHIPMAVVDQSMDSRSQSLIQALVNSQYFNKALTLTSQEAAQQAIDRGAAKVALIIPPGFASDLQRGSASVLFLFDGSDNFAIRSGYSSAALISGEFGLQLDAQQTRLPVTTSRQVLYNPDLTDLWFVLPGIIGLILQTLAIEQAAILIVRDRELGTMEQVLATPARQVELILSKMVALLALCLVDLALILVIAIFWFRVPFQGSLWVYLWLSLLFIASCLGLGLFISTRTNTQREAESLAVVFMLFGILLSGFIFPRIGMPLIPQVIGDLVPLTYFIRISQGIFTKGVGMQFLWGDALALAIYTLLVIIIAAKRFKMRLD